MIVSCGFFFVILITSLSTVLPILGGHKVNKIEQYKFVVSLQERKKPSGVSAAPFRHICGGTLLNKRWILTAAHCVFSKDIKDIRAVIGQISLTPNDLIMLKVVGLELLNFNENTLENDIAMLKISGGPSLIDNEVASLLLNGIPSIKNLKCEILGYGSKMYGSPSVEELYVGAVKVLENIECTSILGKIMAPKNGDNKFCAAGNGTDTCEFQPAEFYVGEKRTMAYGDAFTKGEEKMNLSLFPFYHTKSDEKVKQVSPEKTFWRRTEEELSEYVSHMNYKSSKRTKTKCLISMIQHQGDSGGPMICQFENQTYVYGITSNGIQCSDDYVPSIYTRVEPFAKWICSNYRC